MNKLTGQRSLTLVPALALFFGVLSPIPASANVVESCVGDKCTVTFAYSGMAETFVPPSNAKNLTFELAGGQGGKNGGGGGQVSGQLLVVPELLYVFVGGAGGSGSGIAGGFNGGGVSGSGSNYEGSGGGASDLRTGLDPSTRIAVAGGGGGRGGGTSSGGGTGGGLVAGNGKTAQGFGGTGGSQQSAGIGGAQNGSGTAGSSGNGGVGGTGGTSTLYGGGGGGGGYFGGGGGGSDTDPCCSDAGGGGGGSSYTDPSLVTNVIHTQGLWPGFGRVIIRYQLAPTVFETSAEVSGNKVAFGLEFNGPVSGLAVSDFEINHSLGQCTTISLTGSGSSYQLTLSGCDDGELSVAMYSNSVANTEVSGPIEQFLSSTIVIDTLAPTASWSQTSSSGSELTFSEPISGLELSALEITAADQSCGLSALIQQSPTNWRVSTIGCEQSDFTLGLIALSVMDISGNSGPISAVSTSFTAELPEPPAQESHPEPVEEPGTEPDPEPTEEPIEEPADIPAEEPMEQPSTEPVDEDSQKPVDVQGEEPSEDQSEPEVPGPANQGTPSAPESDSPEDSNVIQEPLPDSLPALSQPPQPEPEPTVGQEVGFAPQLTPNPEPNSYDAPAENPPEASILAGPDSERISVDPEYFASPPASSLPQASQIVTIPAQGFESNFGPNGWLIGFMAMGIFALAAGLIVARRGIPGFLSS